MGTALNTKKLQITAFGIEKIVPNREALGVLIEIYTFQVTVRFLCSDNVSRRCSCSGNIGALASVVLLFLNARPVVSDEPARSSAGQ